jgi:ribosome-associated protein
MGRKKTVFEWQRDAPEEEEQEGRASRGNAKREEQVRKELVKQLLSLSARERGRLPLSEVVLEALDEVSRMQGQKRRHSSHRRQMLHIAGLLRYEELEPVRAALAKKR